MYIPDRGDFIDLSLPSSTPSEPIKKRFALVISAQKFNQVSSLAFVCPITTKVKGFPFEVKLPDQLSRVYGVVLIHHLRSIDWRERKVEYIETAPREVMEEVIAKLTPLIL
jgi:mRNA interferase MazF